MKKLIRNITLLALMFFAGISPLYANAVYRVNAYYGELEFGDPSVQYNFLMLFPTIKESYVFDDLIGHDFRDANLDGSAIVHPPVQFSNGVTDPSFFFEPGTGTLSFDSLDRFSWEHSMATHFTASTGPSYVSGGALVCSGCGDVVFPLYRVTITPLPEPGTLWLLAGGASLFCFSVRKRLAGAGRRIVDAAAVLT